MRKRVLVYVERADGLLVFEHRDHRRFDPAPKLWAVLAVFRAYI
jgi:hypothetical protein